MLGAERGFWAMMELLFDERWGILRRRELDEGEDLGKCGVAALVDVE